jgi:hypothetical protein
LSVLWSAPAEKFVANRANAFSGAPHPRPIVARRWHGDSGHIGGDVDQASHQCHDSTHCFDLRRRVGGTAEEFAHPRYPHHTEAREMLVPAGTRAAVSGGGQKPGDGIQALHHRASQLIRRCPGGKCELDAQGHQARHGRLSQHPQRVLHLELGRDRLIPHRQRDGYDDAETRCGHVISRRADDKKGHEERGDDPQQPKHWVAYKDHGADQDEGRGRREDGDDRQRLLERRSGTLARDEKRVDGAMRAERNAENHGDEHHHRRGNDHACDERTPAGVGSKLLLQKGKHRLPDVFQPPEPVRHVTVRRS